MRKYKNDAGRESDVYAFLPKGGNMARQLGRVDHEAEWRVPPVPVANPVSAARPKSAASISAQDAVAAKVLHKEGFSIKADVAKQAEKALGLPKGSLSKPIADFLHKPALKPRVNKKPATKRVKEPRTQDTKRAKKKDLRDRKEYMKAYMAKKRAEKKAGK